MFILWGFLFAGAVYAFIKGFIWILEYFIGHLCSNYKKRYEYDYTNFETFLKVYNSFIHKNYYITHKRKRIYIQESGYWGSTVAELSKEDIKFNDKLMLLYPIDYIQYRYWFWTQRPTITNKRKGLWNDSDKL